MFNKTLSRCAIVLACSLLTSPVRAAWPSQPVTIVVPFPGGQTGDIIARTVGEQLSKRLGYPFVIENRPGAGGTVGTGYAAQANNNGYTLLLTSTGPFAIAPALYAKLAYDPLRDFEAVAHIAATPQILVANPDAGIDSAAGLIQAAKTQDLSYASAGNGSTQHLTMEVFNKENAIKMVHIPFKGSAESSTNVMGGQVPVASDSLPAILPAIKNGKLRALAVVDSERSPYLPDVPTLAEQGLPVLSTVAFFGLMAPKGTDAAIVGALNTHVNDILQTPAVQQRFATLALTAAKPKSAQQFREHLASEVNKWASIVRDAGARID